MNERAIGAEILKVENISLSFGVMKVLDNISFDIRQGEIRSIIGPNGAGKSSMLNVINGFYHPQQGSITFKGETRKQMAPHVAASSRYRAHVSEYRPVQGYEYARQHHDRT